MSDSYVTSTIADAVFSDGSTLSGTWTTEYDEAGAIVGITASQFTVTGVGGTTTFTNAYVLPYANPNDSGTYQITFPTVSGGSYDGLYIDWKGQDPTSLDAGSGAIYSSVKNVAAGDTPLHLASGGAVHDAATAPHSFIRSTLSDAVFSDGTTLSGSWVTEYDQSGKIVGITDARFVASGPGGTTTFTNPYALSYANPASSGAYQITFPTVSGGSYDGLYVDWVGQQPGKLDVGSGSIYSSIENKAGSGTPVKLQSGGTVQDARVTVVTTTISGATFADGTVISGSWTATYDAGGHIVTIDNAHFTATGAGGTTTFSNGYVLSYANPASNGNYQITFPTVSGGHYDSLYVDWTGQYPTLLDAGSNNIYTSIKNQAVGNDPIGLASGGSPYDGAACFVAGTMIATPSGERMVETLVAGDTVRLADGGDAVIGWIGQRSLSPRRHPRPDCIRPVRIDAHAFADGVPGRPLWLSPDHAVLLGGLLIPAKVLVNGANVVQCDVERVQYVHIELAQHAALLAEGAAAESYLDTGNRAVFSNAATAPILHPDLGQTMREAVGFAPFAESGPAVEAVRAAILARAGGLELTDDPALDIVQGECAVIRSRSAVPAEIGPAPDDRRRLGVKIAALHADGREIPLDHPALVTGWHAIEADGRWTNGAAVVPASVMNGAKMLTVTLAASLSYPVRNAA